jgi:DNA-binding Lrp family transcriptional regulator
VFDLYSRQGLLIPDDYSVVHMPFAHAKVYNFFDYSRLLEQAFDLKLPPGNGDAGLHDGAYGTTNRVELSRIERKVLKGLTKNPDLLDSSISKRIDVTRQSVTKMRKRFQDLDLFFTIRVPNLELLGFELLAFVHTQYRPTSSLKDRAGSLSKIYDDLPIIFKADTDSEGVELVAARNYRDYEAYFGNLVNNLRANGAIDRDPRAMLFTFDDYIAIKNHVYSPGLTRTIEQD